MTIELSHLEQNKTAKIVEIKGCQNTQAKMQSMGIRVGKTVKKISGQKFSGPQIIKIDNLQIALGFGMAKHILVKIEDNN